ncbi:hypothetical protein [Nocardia sp. NBC_01327]|uniref:hypothetical protein n=1 Tax=Nocardia sp. NBC_01327 TaxID=2903593 RepID=UPI002E155052|nr:hypothetical protein OG326_02835 [Nocardia sp. NBC_01327]
MPHEDPNHLYLSHAAIRDLADLLTEIPSLAEDLEDAVACRTRLGDPGLRLSSRSNDQPLPYSVGAAKVRDHLHALLVSWTRLICEQRALDYAGPTSTPGLSRWLHRNLIALAMTEGIESAPTDLRSAVEAAERIICPPSEQIPVTTDALESARRAKLNASGISTLAKELGDAFKSITPRRIQTLRDSGRLAPVPGPWSPDWPEQFVVGEVLDAHLAYPARRRKSAEGAAAPHRSRLRIEVTLVN